MTVLRWSEEMVSCARQAHARVQGNTTPSPSSNSPYRETPHKAGVVANLVGPAAFATQDMAAQCRTAALLDSRHDLELAQAQVTPLSLAPGRSMEAEDVGDFQGGARHDDRTTTTAASPAG